MRPEVGTQPNFKKQRPPRKYRYDDSLAPSLEWDERNPARDRAQALIEQALAADTLEASKAAVSRLKAMNGPFLNWAGKAERPEISVPTLPLFIHERLSTKAILGTLQSHRRDKQTDMFSLFGDPQHSVTDQVLRAYEHRDAWVNRMILGDSLVVMNSLLEYEGLGGQVQMIYMDPPYGVKFGSNFQPFVRKRDVKNNDDADLTREPETVKAYRDTWELGIHSYLTYLRDRLTVARKLLAPSGSIFVQISDENVHRVREVLDEVMGVENFCAQIVFRKTTGKGSALLDNTYDVLLWYARDAGVAAFRPLFLSRLRSDDPNFRFVELPGGGRRALTAEELRNVDSLPGDYRVFRANPLTSQSASATTVFEYEFRGSLYRPGKGGWKTNLEGMENLAKARRLMAIGNTLCFVRYHGDLAFQKLGDIWDDTRQSGFGDEKVYAVQTAARVVEHCVLMTTRPGDLVLDPTCGSGTTAAVAEKWGRRWVTIDTSRVPLALARQRLLTATYDWYKLKDAARGPAGGFVYERRQNSRGEEVGGIVPHVTLESIAKDEPPKQEVLVDRPEIQAGITRVSGPFCFEATIPTPQDWGGTAGEAAATPAEERGAFQERMLEVLRKSPNLHLAGGRKVTLRNVRPVARSLSLSAEADVGAADGLREPTLDDVVRDAAEGSGRTLPFSTQHVAIVFGPENGAVSERLVDAALREAGLKHYSHLYVVGFAVEPNARLLIENSDAVAGLPATYVQATTDILMGDLLKNLRSSQIFSVCGLPDIEIRKWKQKGAGGRTQFEVKLLGLDVFDPVEMTTDHRSGDDVPAWFLDTDYNGLCFHVCQAFFPRTGAWDSLKKAMRAEFEESVWDHLAGGTSAPFAAGEHRRIAVKVIDDRGNELLVEKELP